MTPMSQPGPTAHQFWRIAYVVAAMIGVSWVLTVGLHSIVNDALDHGGVWRWIAVAAACAIAINAVIASAKRVDAFVTERR